MKFAKGFFAGKLRRYYKSEPIPADSPALVKKVVANSFIDIVLNPKKDVLFMSTTQRCALCREILPDWERLAEHVKDIQDLDIVIMDSDKNKAQGMAITRSPTIMLFPMETNKPFDIETANKRKNYEGFLEFLGEKSKAYEKARKEGKLKEEL
jgi:thioredoxin-like negative regulator of GroEL